MHKKDKKRGALVISLDFELVWGIFDHIKVKDRIAYFDNTLKAIPLMLELFEKYNIHVTWATVGMLFNRNWEEWQENIPSLLPTYKNQNLDPYKFGLEYRKEGYDKYFFAPHLIKEIQVIDFQEIGTHTYSHYYSLEAGQTEAQFEADLGKSIIIAKNMDIKLKSLVFPRNQFNKDYLKCCTKLGIDSVRSNPSIWYWDTMRPTTLKTKLFRTADAYLPFTSKSYSSQILLEERPFCQPASRFLRPQHKIQLLNDIHVMRVKKEMIEAAKKGEIYHLWWHPHNFGVDPQRALKKLKDILEAFKHCKETFDFESLNMQELHEVQTN
jgi:peptidoglycan/xylan/chitin deacetylase (PgdA/CDA1 family)